MHEYEAPSSEDLGSLQEMTLQLFNKIGPAADKITAVDPSIVGSLTPFP